MNKKLQAKLKNLPAGPGVYLHKSKSGEIIYVGKAARLKNRVRHYFQNPKLRDLKTSILVSEIEDTDWIETESEIDALFLESELVKRYKPHYNILLRDDKSQLFVRINMKADYPYICFTRQPMDDGADYYGPYYNGFAIKKALRYLRKAFPYSTHSVLPKRVCLQYHLGLCPGVEEAKINSKEYKVNLRKLIMYLKGERKRLVASLEKEMQQAAKKKDFELAAKIRDQISNLRQLQRQIIFSDREFLDISKDEALVALSDLLGIDIPKRIEGYDISHMQGTNNVASMVVATNGIADKAQYRKFKMNLPGNDDFGHMREVMTRRFSERNKSWPRPDLILIDGGPGQLGAASGVLKELNINIPIIGIAKKLEQIVVKKDGSNVSLNLKNQSNFIHKQTDEFDLVDLHNSSSVVKLIQRIRDESHRFAVAYHTTLKRKGQLASELEEIPGIGPATRKKVIKAFGSIRAIQDVDEAALVKVVGQAKAKLLKSLYL